MFQSGTLLQDRYQVLESLGRGGFSQTFAVKDGDTLKVLKVLVDHYEKAIALFQREAYVLSQLHHPGIPAVAPDGYFTQAVDPSSTAHCLVMEYIPGVNLSQWMSQTQHRPILEPQAIAWLKQLSEILQQIHQHRYFHRDIKPSNIMLKPDGQLVLIDFGAVRKATPTLFFKHKAHQQGTHLYSRGYTPVEQMQGRAIPRSDFFALGRTFVYLLTGKHPLEFSFDAKTGTLHWRQAAPQVSSGFADLIDQLMASLPGQRPSSPRSILRRLEQFEEQLSSPLSMCLVGC
jgi:serine/threonine protein kinase